MSGTLGTINTQMLGTNGDPGGGVGQSESESYVGQDYGSLAGGAFDANAQAGNGGPGTGRGGDGGSASFAISGGNLGSGGAPFPAYTGDVGGSATAIGGSGGTGDVAGDGGAATAEVSGMQFITTGNTGLDLTASGGGGLVGGDATASMVNTTATVSYSASGTSRTAFAAVLNANGGGNQAPGTGGNATATMSGNVFSAANVVALLETTIGTEGGDLNGAASLMTFTDNTFHVGAATPSAPDELDLSFQANGGPSGTEIYLQLDAAAGGNLVFSGNDFIGDGGSTLNFESQDANVDGANGVIDIDTAHDTLSIAGSPANGMSGFDSFNLSGDDQFVVGTGTYTVVAQVDLNYLNTDTLVYTPASNDVTVRYFNLYSSFDGFLNKVVLDFQGFGSALTAAEVQAATTITDGNTYIEIPGTGTIDLEGYTSAIPAGDLVVACFAAGSRIRTDRGEIAVEHLAVGAMLQTRAGGFAPVKWIGHRRLDCRRHPHPARVWPVRVAAGAFGDGCPLRDLLLSPDHAVLVGEVLIPIRHLINGATIAQVPVDKVSYYHVELPRHAVLLAEGLACESYLDTGNRSAFANGGFTAVHADFAAHLREAEACAPLVVVGAEVAAARGMLLERAGILACLVTIASASASM